MEGPEQSILLPFLPDLSLFQPTEPQVPGPAECPESTLLRGSQQSIHNTMAGAATAARQLHTARHHRNKFSSAFNFSKLVQHCLDT